MAAEWNERHEASYLLSSHHLYRLSDIMKWRKFLSVPKIHRRPRSKARSETSPIEGQSGVDSVVSPPTVESTPDLRIGASTLPTSSPLTLHDQESNGKQASRSWAISLSTLFFFVQQTPAPYPTKPHPFPKGIKTASRNLQTIPLTQERHPRTNQTGSPPHMPQPS